MYLLGVDGGASQTRCLVAKLDGTIIGSGFAGCANKNITSWKDSILQVRMAVIEACAKADILPGEIVSAHYGLGGIYNEACKQKWKAALEDLSPEASIKVENDVFLAIPAAQQEIGIAVVSGSGGNIGAITPKRKFHLNGIVNFHSAQLGRKALQQAMVQLQASRDVPPFASALLDLSRLDANELRFALRTRRKELIQELSPFVIELYRQGHNEARGIVHSWLDVVSDDIRKFQTDHKLEYSPVCFGGATFASMGSLIDSRLSVNGKVFVASVSLTEGAIKAAARCITC